MHRQQSIAQNDLPMPYLAAMLTGCRVFQQLAPFFLRHAFGRKSNVSRYIETEKVRLVFRYVIMQYTATRWFCSASPTVSQIKSGTDNFPHLQLEPFLDGDHAEAGIGLLQVKAGNVRLNLADWKKWCAWDLVILQANWTGVLFEEDAG